MATTLEESTLHGFDVGGPRLPIEGLAPSSDTRLVQRSVDQLFNRSVTGVLELVRVGRLRLVSEAAAARVCQTMVEPVREIADRGGKSWRSSAMLVACEAVGGDPGPLEDYVGVIELLHVGSLIVDDVQDGANVRRGGPSCHVLRCSPIAVDTGGLVKGPPGTSGRTVQGA